MTQMTLLLMRLSRLVNVCSHTEKTTGIPHWVTAMPTLISLSMIQSSQPDDPNLQYSFSSECLSFSKEAAAHHHKWKMLAVIMFLAL